MKGAIIARRPIENKYRADYDILIDSIEEDVDLGALSDFPIITIYFDPTDYPGKYVARIFDIRPGEVCRLQYIMLGESLEEIRLRMPESFVRMDRKLEDDEKILEVWI